MILMIISASVSNKHKQVQFIQVSFITLKCVLHSLLFNLVSNRLGSNGASYSNDSTYCQDIKNYNSVQTQWNDNGFSGLEGKKEHLIYEEIGNNHSKFIYLQHFLTLFLI